ITGPRGSSEFRVQRSELGSGFQGARMRQRSGPARRRKRSSPSKARRVRPVAARRRRAAEGMSRLVAIMATLRSPRGCPWDRKQTHDTLRPFLLEETYEALDALDRGDLDALPGELGDVMFQCVFHAQIASETGRFDLGDALDAIVAKLIRRHPH